MPNVTCNMKEQPIGILLFLLQSRKKMKVTLERAMKAPRGGEDCNSTLSLTLAVDAGRWSIAHPGHFTLGQTWSPLHRKLGGPQG